MTKYYVYEYLAAKTGSLKINDEYVVTIFKGAPYYVGKGKLTRIVNGPRNYNAEAVTKALGREILIKAENLTAEQAEKMERDLIERYSMEEKHILTNHDFNSKGIVEALKHQNIPLDFENMTGHHANRYRFDPVDDELNIEPNDDSNIEPK
ncbi:MAG: hypothetical protein KBT36_11215 [Kurthia sp.]|nr:hypothetical protein [Candidatus Kurthia equi]